MASQARSRDWAAYYTTTEGRPPRETLLIALERFGAEPAAAARTAVDLGAGGGRDTVELLRRGWRVLAIDAAPEAAATLAARPNLPGSGALVTRTARFEEALWPATDLVNAGFALPLCPPEAFPALWRRVIESLRPGGRFAGQLYGERDGLAGRPGITVHAGGEVDALLAGLAVEHRREEETDAVTPRGRPKHWHIHHIVARKA